jgi:hypothetical protein
MTVRAIWLRIMIGFAVVGSGCTPSTAPTATPQPSESRAPPVGGLPQGCGPIDLRTTSGERVDLAGTWIQVDTPGSEPTTWWIQTLGDCVWGVGKVDELPEDPLPATVQHLTGRIRTDFVIEGEIVLVGPNVDFLNSSIFSPVEIIIDFDDAGQISLREDREHGVEGPRCPSPANYCPRPVILRRSGSGN